MNTTTIETTGYSIEKGDGKGITIPEGYRMVKASEKKEGKGKGKTIAFALLPTIQIDFSEDAVKNAVTPMLGDLLEELQKDVITRMAREGAKGVSVEELSIPALAAEYANRTFSEESVGNWFDLEMADVLAYYIATAKGWNVDELNDEQMKFLETKCAAYRATYLLAAKKFPPLDANQVKELIRVLDLSELSGPIVSAIREKITPKPVSAALGFE